MSDEGYFGPASVTWRVMAEPVTMVGGLRALLLQALHPEAMTLLHQLTRYRNAPWTRLTHTGEFVATVTFAPRADADAAAVRVRAIHHKLGVDRPHLLQWIHATEVESFLVSAQRAGTRLSRADADRFVLEQKAAGRLVGVPEERLPGSVTDLVNYFAQVRPELRLTPEAIEAAQLVIAPPIAVRPQLMLPARVGWTTLSGLAVGLLPRWARRMYGLPGLAVTDVANTVALRTLRLGVAQLPENIRQGPAYRAALARTAIPAA